MKKNIYLLTFYDAQKEDIFSIRHCAESAKDAREWFLKKYSECVLLLNENIKNAITNFNWDFED